MNFRILSLPENLFENAIDFIMEYYIAREVVHRSLEITSSKEAMDDYRQVITTVLKDPLYQTTICCLDNGSEAACVKIVGMSVSKIISKNDVDDEYIQPKTKAVAEYFEIMHLWNNIFSVTDYMRKYNVDYIHDDRGLAVHPDYERHGISRKLVQVRLMICVELGIPMTGAWLTSHATQKLSEQYEDVDTWFEISSEEIGRQLGISIPDAPATIKYVVVYTSALNRHM